MADLSKPIQNERFLNLALEKVQLMAKYQIICVECSVGLSSMDIAIGHIKKNHGPEYVDSMLAIEAENRIRRETEEELEQRFAAERLPLETRNRELEARLALAEQHLAEFIAENNEENRPRVVRSVS